MDVYELVEKLGGEIVLNRARVRVGGEIITVGRIDGMQMVFTEEGSRLVAEMEKPVEEAKSAAEEPKKRGRPAKSAVVESDQIEDNLFDNPETGLT